MLTLKQKVDVEAPHLLGHPNALKTRTLSVENASKMPTLKQKVGVQNAKVATLRRKVRRKFVPFARKGLRLQATPPVATMLLPPEPPRGN